MDVATMKYLYVLVVLIGTKVASIAGDCKIGSKVTSIRYSETIVNHTIVGPVLSSITAINERECEKECHLAVPNLCSMFNYYPSSKVCELLYKDRASEYKVKKKNGSTFKTRKCISNLCLSIEECLSFGNQTTDNLCLFTGQKTKTNTTPVCIGTKDNSYGKFFAPADGEIKTFKLVHIWGWVSRTFKYGTNSNGTWGTRTSWGAPSKIELHITDNQNSRITPPEGYPVDTNAQYGTMTYDVPGFNNMSPELVFPEISPPLAVTKGKEFRIWFGQDLTNRYEGDNYGTTCADVYVYYNN